MNTEIPQKFIGSLRKSQEILLALPALLALLAPLALLALLAPLAERSPRKS